MFRFSVDISNTPLNNIVLETQFMTLTFPLFNCKLQVDFYHTTTVFPNFLEFEEYLSMKFIKVSILLFVCLFCIHL